MKIWQNQLLTKYSPNFSHQNFTITILKVFFFLFHYPTRDLQGSRSTKFHVSVILLDIYNYISYALLTFNHHVIMLIIDCSYYY